MGGRIGGHYLFSTGPWSLGPVGHIDFLTQNQDAFSERGAGSTGFRMSQRDVDSFQSGLGIVVRYQDEIVSEGLVWVPEFRAKWIREWLDDDRSIEAALIGGPRITVQGDDPRRDTALLGLGLRVRDSEWFGFGFDYDLAIDEDVLSHSLRGAFEIRF